MPGYTSGLLKGDGMERFAGWICALGLGAVLGGFAIAACGQGPANGIVRLTDGGGLVAVTGKSGAAMVVPAGKDGRDHWWNHAVLYEIYPRSFQDSNGDGIGDINGIASRLDYLKDLGVDAIWITPMYPSPGVDYGYDIADYTAIDPEYGTMADFDRMVAALVQANLLIKRTQLAVNPRPNETIARELGNLFLEFAFPAAHDRRENHHPFAFRQRQHALQDLIDALACDGLAALWAMRLSDGRKQQAQIIVNLSDRADGRTRTAGHGLLFDRDGRRQSFDRVDVGFFQLIEKLPRVRRQRFDVPPLAFGVNRVEGQRRLA